MQEPLKKTGGKYITSYFEIIGDSNTDDFESIESSIKSIGSEYKDIEMNTDNMSEHHDTMIDDNQNRCEKENIATQIIEPNVSEFNDIEMSIDNMSNTS